MYIIFARGSSNLITPDVIIPTSVITKAARHRVILAVRYQADVTLYNSVGDRGHAILRQTATYTKRKLQILRNKETIYVKIWSDGLVEALTKLLRHVQLQFEFFPRSPLTKMEKENENVVYSGRALSFLIISSR